MPVKYIIYPLNNQGKSSIYALLSHSDKDSKLKKYESFILAEPMIPAGLVPPQDIHDEIKGMVFRFSSSPGTVPERSYLANNSAQRRMSLNVRFEMAKHNFPSKVNFLVKMTKIFNFDKNSFWTKFTKIGYF